MRDTNGLVRQLLGEEARPKKPVRRRVEILVMKGGKVLVGKYLRFTTGEHFHSLPGGGIEEGEDAKETVRREILEEAGIKVKNIRDLNIMIESPPPSFIPNYRYSKVVTEWYACDYDGEDLDRFNSARDGMLERLWLGKKEALQYVNDSLYADGAIKAINRAMR
jgi:8-oxo-dGTP pyrophosphatase MutT (NUDIX family)